MVAGFPGWLSTLSSSLTWQITLLIIICAFFQKKEAIAKLIKNIKISGNGYELIINLISEAAEVSSKIEATNTTNISATDNQEQQKILAVAKGHPTLIVLESWKELEIEILKLQESIKFTRLSTIKNFMDVLYQREKITAQDYELFNILRQIRNNVVHGGNSRSMMSIDEAQKFLHSTIVLLNQLRKLRDKLGDIVL